jgi:subtilase family serine protease
MRQLVKALSFLVVAIVLALPSLASPVKTPAVQSARSIDENQVITLEGNVHPLARADFDLGMVAADTQFNRMLLQLAPTAAQQAELDALVAAQHNPESPLYHHWLTPAEYGARFGASPQDLARITAWLTNHGFTVEEIPASQRLVIFSGTAGQISDTFHTEIHHYRVNGVDHLANSQDPQIPSALSSVVRGVVSLHDFRRASAIASRRQLGAPLPAGPRALYSAGSTHYLFPADYASIYDLNSLYSSGTTGAGTSVAVVGRSNINLSDVTAFRSQSALSANLPTVVLVGNNPGLVSGDQDESTLDVEWAGAIAPATSVKFVVGASTNSTDGVDLSAQYIVNHATAPVVTTSYGSCEQEMGSTELAFYNSLWEQAASQGMSSFVSSGDAGAAGCNIGSNSYGSGASVNGLCSSPYSTCVGGTEFQEGANPSQYWSATNGSGYSSALGYIPEQAWNESASNSGSGLWATGGGISTVYAQPAWQAGVSGTSAANGMRSVPDVAMAAASHDGYIMYENGSFWVIAGTSAASPTFAAIMALVIQKQAGVGQGNASAKLYPLLNASLNPFHTTPSGSNSVPGVTGFQAGGAAYNLATGLGSVDGAVLVNNWTSDPVIQPATLTLTAASTSLSLVQGGSNAVQFTAATGGSFAGSVGFVVSGLPSGVTASWSGISATPSAAVTTLTLTASELAKGGAARIVVTAAGDRLTSVQDVDLLIRPRQACYSLPYSLNSRCNSPVRGRILLP